VDHHLALLPGGIVLHLAVDHVDVAGVGDRLDHFPDQRDLVGIGEKTFLAISIVHRVELAAPTQPSRKAAQNWASQPSVSVISP
jgi:hypothetical protein